MMGIDNLGGIGYNNSNLATVDLPDCYFCNHRDTINFRPQAALIGSTVASYPQALEAVAFTAKNETSLLPEIASPFTFDVNASEASTQ